MDRDEAAFLLIVLVCGALVWLAGAFTPSSRVEDERAAWRCVWLPAVPASLPFFMLLGFAVADPEGPQSLHTTRLLAMAPFGVVWVRAAIRALRALRATTSGPAVTKGLLRPRIEISPEIHDALHPGERRAVMAHEGAHVRHRDPLRIWLVQAMTDLQWPLFRPRARQHAWLQALELARDEEAVHQADVDAADLASAILVAARLAQPRVGAVAALTNDASLLETRVRRLLAPEAIRARTSGGSLLVPLALGLALPAFLFGLFLSSPLIAILAGSP